MPEVKATAKLELPEKVDENTGIAIKTIAEGVSSILKIPERVVNIVENTGNTLFSPLSEALHGKAEIIKAQNYAKAQKIRREVSQYKLAQNVLENLSEKHQNGESIPDHIDDTDHLFAIQNAASETNDDDFLRFWSQIYTEEACKPNTVSKKTIEICRIIDKKVAKILEDEVFPYCSDSGFVANIPPKATNLLLLKDYGLVDNVPDNIIIYPVTFEEGYPALSRDIFGKYWLWVHPGYSYRLQYRLTEAGKEIRNALKIFPQEQHLKTIGDTIKKEAQHWTRLEGFTFNKDVDADDLFVITDQIYPQFMRYPHPKYRKFERYWEAVRDTVSMTKIP